MPRVPGTHRGALLFLEANQDFCALGAAKSLDSISAPAPREPRTTTRFTLKSAVAANHLA